MPGWAIALFWIWFAVSLVIFVIRRVKARRGELDGGGLLGRPSGSGDTVGGASVDPATKEWPTPPPPEPEDDTFRIDPGAGDPSAAPTPSADAPTEPAPREPTPTLTPTPAAATGGPVPGGATLPELLAGITLPHELVPLTQLDASVDIASRIIVATGSASADQVRQGLIDELERLGYTVEHSTMLALVATGERGRVYLDIHADGPATTDGGAPRFPTAPEGSVVVEIRAG